MTQQHILQVSELTKKVRFMLESELNTVWLCGEISNLVQASSGHWYLSLKDAKSQVKCAMFKGNNRKVRIKPSNGQQVLVRAKVSLYEPRGDFQLIIESMESAGEGLLRQQYEQLKNKLHAQGLFEQHYKQTIPSNIKTLGVITSPTGAAITDILTVLKRRNPLIKVIIYPTLVQGEQAKFDIEHAIKKANLRQECDVLIVGRGGGSLEDLWPFNEECVVQAIYHSKLPIISAVGHEIDTTLADYVADLRAPTPSAAAELASQDTKIVYEKLSSLYQRIKQQQARYLSVQNNKLQVFQHRLNQVHPEQKLRIQQQRLDDINQTFMRAIKRNIERKQVKPQSLIERLHYLSPLTKIQQKYDAIKQYQQRLQQAMLNIQQKKSYAFSHLIEQLHLVSPLATIARGYSVTRNTNKKVITQLKQVAEGDLIHVQVTDGTIQARVQSIETTTKANDSVKLHSQANNISSAQND